MGSTSSYGGGSIESLGLDAVGSGNPNTTAGAALIATDASAIGASAGSTDTVQGVLEAIHSALGGGGGGTVQGTDGTYDIQATNEGATAGNARGENSVDLQTVRSAANQVASAANTVIAGGSGNRASAQGSVVGGGESNFSANTYATIAGGGSHTSSGNGSSIGGGLTNSASGTASTVPGGSTCNASAHYSTVGGGQDNTASATHSIIPGGNAATATHKGELAHASSLFSGTPGTAQRSVLQWVDETTNAAQAEMFLDNSSARFTLSNDDLYHATIKVMAVAADGSFALWTWLNVVAVKIGAGNVAVTNGGTSVTPDITAGSTDMSVCLVDVDADTGNAALRIQVTGIAATTIKWFAYADCGKVNF